MTSGSRIEETRRLVKEFIVDVWEVRKQELYGEDNPLISISVRPWLEIQGLLVGVSKIRKFQDKVKLGFMYTLVMWYMVIVAPPIVVSEWSTTSLLRQHVEYYH